MTLNVAGADVAIDTTLVAQDTPEEVVAAINTALQGGTDDQKAVTASLDEKTGEIVLTGKADGTGTVDVKANFAKETAAGDDAQVGSVVIKGATTETQKNDAKDLAVTTTNGAVTGNAGKEAKAEVVGTFDIDLSKAKFDTGIENYSLNGAAAAKVSGTVTTESVASLDLSTQEGAQNAIDVLDSAMEQVDEKRAEIGAFQNRMTHTMSNLANINENVNASNSRIKDVDFASETINMTKGQILQQAGTSILAQAKQIPQAALSLLG
ncbi:flagellin [Photobacterium andalusiense]